MDPLSKFLIELVAGLAGKALEEILEALPRRLRKSVQDDPVQKDALRIALKAGLEAAGRTDPRVVRGGAWGVDPWHIRCACRGWREPDLRGNLLGFRVVVPPVSP